MKIGFGLVELIPPTNSELNIKKGDLTILKPCKNWGLTTVQETTMIYKMDTDPVDQTCNLRGSSGRSFSCTSGVPRAGSWGIPSGTLGKSWHTMVHQKDTDGIQTFNYLAATGGCSFYFLA